MQIIFYFAFSHVFYVRAGQQSLSQGDEQELEAELAQLAAEEQKQAQAQAQAQAQVRFFPTMLILFL